MSAHGRGFLYDLSDPVERDCWLADMAERGATTEYLAKTLKMPEFAVLMRIMWLKEEGMIGGPKKLVDRLCLSCRGEFMSAGPHNRMCDHCRESA